MITASPHTPQVVGDGYGVLITYPPIIPTDSQGSTPIRGAAKRGIFDREDESGTEMGWSSDESTSISPSKSAGTQQDLLALCTGTLTDITRTNTSTSTDSFIKKGVWSEEESRCLLEGVEKFGEGKWKEIRAESYSVLKHRTTNQLKDKYRNIKGRPKH